MELKFEDYEKIARKVIGKFIHSQSDERFGELFSESYFVFLKCVNLYDYEKGCKFSTYFYNKMRFHIFDYLRKQRKHNDRFQYGVDEELLGSEIMEEIEECDDSNELILSHIKHTLTEKQYDIFYMYFVEGINLADIANKYNTSKQNISQTIKRVQKKMN